jgi:hypothetical protein
LLEPGTAGGFFLSLWPVLTLLLARHFAAPALPILLRLSLYPSYIRASLAGPSPCAHFADMAGSRAYGEALKNGR